MPTEQQQRNEDKLRFAGKSLAQIAQAHTWAAGCGECRHGMLIAPELNELSTNPLYMQRAIQAAHHEVIFCECKAGVQMRAYLRRVWVGELQGHDIEEDMPVPTFHYEQAKAFVPVLAQAGGAAYS